MKLLLLAILLFFIFQTDIIESFSGIAQVPYNRRNRYNKYGVYNIPITKSYGYPFQYTPVKENCVEPFQMTKHKVCVPIAVLTLYTTSGCPHCKSMKPEWNKFVDHVKKNCMFDKLIKIEHKVDDEIDDPTVKYVPAIKLHIKPDLSNDKPERIVYFSGQMLASSFEKFVVENISNHSALEQEGAHYTECGKGKMYGKYNTICDKDHKHWNTPH